MLPPGGINQSMCHSFRENLPHVQAWKNSFDNKADYMGLLTQSLVNTELVNWFPLLQHLQATKMKLQIRKQILRFCTSFIQAQRGTIWFVCLIGIQHYCKSSTTQSQCCLCKVLIMSSIQIIYIHTSDSKCSVTRKKKAQLADMASHGRLQKLPEPKLRV